ncbi:nucleoside triphosphate pyrophosphohydrolase [Helicovermis profundi]|uniref:Nucleoside triphosphate pyrophosphohydrolase n=1 Tax=Helicovermis profundi TaxID=3065157 RepID=A0AAU9EBD7_9FIRM|nr:nucleoside triphosphate pyrophosphohydrolase [Clostridia bacterium S502]
MKTYNKLVRDKIPQIIEESGKECSIKYADKDETLKYLISKFDEEIKEFKEEYSVEELADILEIIYGITNNMGIDFSELEMIRKKKYEERGGFNEGIILEKVW